MVIPKKKSIKEILTDSSMYFSIPRYQRNYSWSKGEMQELLSDLKAAVKTENDQNLFLGTFIFDDTKIKSCEIVDGQQRLTSISIIYLACREIAEKLNETKLGIAIQKYLSSVDEIYGQDETKIKVSDNIREAYSYMVHNEWEETFPSVIEGKSVKRQWNILKPIYNYVYNELKGCNADELKKFLKTLGDAYAVVLHVESESDVFALFERTNARGLDLNIGDLLKNHIFSHRQEEHTEVWNDIVQNATGGLERFLKYFWVSRKGYTLRRNLYGKLKDYSRMLDKQESTSINLFIDELHSFSSYNAMIHSANLESTKQWFDDFGLDTLSSNEGYIQSITRNIQALKLFKVKQHIPLVFSFFKCFKKSKSNKESLALRFLENLEKYHFVNNIISDRIGNEVEKFYADYAEKFYHADDCNEVFKEFNNALLKKVSVKEEFVSRFSESLSYRLNRIALIMYFFDRYNNFNFEKKKVLSGGQYFELYKPDRTLMRRNFNIEHFFPQNGVPSASEEQYEYVNYIGNLIVVNRHTNSALGDKSPSEKLSMLIEDKKHSVNIRSIDWFIDDYGDVMDDWGKAKIEMRTAELASMSYDYIFKLK